MERLLVLVRHGQSEWNLKNLFTGWKDVGLTEKGIEEAKAAGARMAGEGMQFDLAYTSKLERAQKTLDLILEAIGQPELETIEDEALNERDYGDLVGLNKDDARKKWGDEQVHIWRRSYDIPPPEMNWDDPLNPCRDRRYAGLGRDVLPNTESLKTTLERVLPYYQGQIEPKLASGQNILISAHGNSLRALIKYLFVVADEKIVEIEIPTGNPLLIELGADQKPIAVKYLDQDRAKTLPEIK